MARINFEQFSMPAGISNKKRIEGDAREKFADILYLHVNGIRAHALALKIYNSQGMTEFTKEEAELIKEVAEAFCVPNFIDGLYEQLENDNK